MTLTTLSKRGELTPLRGSFFLFNSDKSYPIGVLSSPRTRQESSGNYEQGLSTQVLRLG